MNDGAEAQTAFFEVNGVKCSAVLDAARRYRYVLRRRWSEAVPLVVIGLNPSTADEYVDDPTIRRCIGFARAWGHGGLTMLNLFAYRCTNPRELRMAVDPVGDLNTQHIIAETTGPVTILCAWGNVGNLFPPGNRFESWATTVARLLAFDHSKALWHLGITKECQPRHPLYVRGGTIPQRLDLKEWMEMHADG